MLFGEEEEEEEGAHQHQHEQKNTVQEEHQATVTVVEDGNLVSILLCFGKVCEVYMAMAYDR